MKIAQTSALHPPVNSTDHMSGRADAPITLVEYGDFQCPYCYRAHPLVMRLQKRFGIRLRFVFRNFPLSELHPHAAHAAEAAESVGANAGEPAYWTMHDSLFVHQQESDDALNDEHLLRYAAEAGADVIRVKADLASDLYRIRVRSDFLSGVRSGVKGTPTFFIDGVRFDGDWTNLEEFAEALEGAAGGKAAPSSRSVEATLNSN